MRELTEILYQSEAPFVMDQANMNAPLVVAQHRGIGAALGASLDLKKKPSAPSVSDTPVGMRLPGAGQDTTIAANKRDLPISMLRANLIPCWSVF